MASTRGAVDQLSERLLASDPVCAALLRGKVPALVREGQQVIAASPHWHGWLGPDPVLPPLAAVTELRCADGSTLRLEISETAFDFEGHALTLVIANEVGAGLASAALRAAEARFRGLFEQAAVGIAMIESSTGRMIAANRKLCRITGYTAEELMIKGGMAITHPEEAAAAAGPLAEVCAGQRAEWSQETRFIHADGHTGWVLLTIAPLTIEDGKHPHLVTVVQDITDRKRVEAALRERDEQLRESQKLETVGQLAGGIAHDFNNLLTVVLSLTPELEERLGDDTHALTLLRDVHDAGLRASDLTRQLLAFARREFGSPRVIELGPHVEGFRRLLQRIAGDHIGFELDVAPDTPAVRIDPAHLEQVLVNLVVNARDAMPGGGELVIRTRASDRSGSPVAVLMVEDSGSGMTEDVRAHIFEPFYTTKPLGQGTGLGLATVYGIVKQSGGEIEVASAPGHGACFRIAWPATSITNVAAEPTADARRGGRETLLVVEDDDQVRAVLRRMLSTAGYRLLLARDGAEALSIAESNDFDLLLTDLAMPGMQGTEVARSVRERRPHLPVLLMSGYARGLDELDPSHSVLLKPFGEAELLTAVRAALEPNHRATRAGPK